MVKDPEDPILEEKTQTGQERTGQLKVHTYALLPLVKPDNIKKKKSRQEAKKLTLWTLNC